MSIKNIQVGSTASFSIYGSIEGKVEFKGEVVGHVTSEMAAIDPSSGIVINHANIWPTIPEEVSHAYSNSPNSYEYTVIREANGTLTYIGDIWVVNETIAVVNNRTANLELTNFVDVDTLQLTLLLESNGYEIASFSIES